MPNISYINKKKRFPERGFSFYILKEKGLFYVDKNKRFSTNR